MTPSPLHPAAQVAPRNRWSLVVAVGLVVFMATLDGTIVAVALPRLQEVFGVGPGATSWVMLAYLVPLVALALPSGRWLDTVGRRAAFAFTSAGFGVTSLLVGLAPTFPLLIAGRVLQGVFGAALFAIGPVVAAAAVAGTARGRAMGIVATVGPLGAVTGPALGGWFVQHLDWPWIFYVNLPISLLVAGLGLALMPRDGALRLPDRSWLGESALLGGASLALLLGLTLAAESHLALLALSAAAVPLVAVWLRTRPSRSAVALLRTPGLPSAHLALLAFATATMVVVFLLPFYLQRELDLSPGRAGLTLLALPLLTALCSPLGGWLADRFGGRVTAAAGAAIMAVGLALLAPLGAEWSAAAVAWRLAVMGVGSGLIAGPVLALALGLAPERARGTVAASTSTARQLGFALGPALATVAWAAGGYGPLGLRMAMALAAACAALALLALARRSGAPTGAG